VPGSSLERRFADLSRAIDAVLLAGHAQRHWLRDDHPAFAVPADGDETTTMAAALAHYGGAPCAAFDLWCMCRAVDMLDRAWVRETADG
jgi:hypothetical protein